MGAGISGVNKSKPNNAKQDVVDYNLCRKESLNSFKKNPTKVKNAIRKCKDTFPGAALLTDCKKKALKKYKGNKKDLKSALKKCKNSFRLLTFQPKKKLPFVITNKQAFFGGLGLNYPVKIEETPGGNYDCTALGETAKGTRSAEFILFGNHPRVFKPLRSMSTKKLRKVLNIKPESQPFQDTKFGRMYLNESPKRWANYFPTSYCHFDRKIGKIYEAMKVYFLVDQKRKVAHPYFGISFYKKDSKVTNKELVKDTIKTLGSDYSVQSATEDFIYIAQQEFEAFDNEGDPYNVCKEPVRFEYIALIRKENSSKLADFLVLANINNLCKYGIRKALDVKQP